MAVRLMILLLIRDAKSRPISKARRCRGGRVDRISSGSTAMKSQVAQTLIKIVDWADDGNHHGFGPPWHGHASGLFRRHSTNRGRNRGGGIGGSGGRLPGLGREWQSIDGGIVLGSRIEGFVRWGPVGDVENAAGGGGGRRGRHSRVRA